MCLSFEVTPHIPGRVSAERLSKLSGLAVAKRSGILHFSVGGKGCGCPLLTASADFAADFWELEPNVIPALETALTTLVLEAGGFNLSALWAGDAAESESNPSFTDFLAALRANRLRNAHVYRVTPDGVDQGTAVSGNSA
jgi:hypothetical protein